MTFLKSWLPWLVAAICVLYMASLPFRHTKSEAKEDLDALGRLPVLAEGRVKPLDSFARVTLMALSAKQSLTVEVPVTEGDKDPEAKTRERKIPAIEWYLEMLAKPEVADDRPVFRIDHPDLVSTIGFPGSKRTRFSLNEIRKERAKIEEQANLADNTPKRERDHYQRQVLELFQKLMLFQEVRLGRAPFTIAPMAPGEEWKPLAALLDDKSLGTRESTQAIVDLLFASSTGDTEKFNTTLTNYSKRLNEVLPSETHAARAEEIFNLAEPFSHTAALYVFAFLLACFGFLSRTGGAPEWTKALTRSSLLVILLAFAVHTLGIAARVYLQGRPPVTNLYSSAVFIGWACIPLALAAEWFIRLGLGNVAASLIGFSTLIVAHRRSCGCCVSVTPTCEPSSCGREGTATASRTRSRPNKR
ncbi:MAG: hypothetical protein ACOYN0_16745, partial [Phycisphaerales bacterium]